MKVLAALLALTGSLTFAAPLVIAAPPVIAAPLTPTSSQTRDCTVQVVQGTYTVNAVCWKNNKGELRLWFPQDVFQQLRDTGINTKYISNVDAACAQTNEYTYDQIFGADALPEASIKANPVDITAETVDVSVCFATK